jgi:hypothetical protein
MLVLVSVSAKKSVCYHTNFLNKGIFCRITFGDPGLGLIQKKSPALVPVWW